MNLCRVEQALKKAEMEATKVFNTALSFLPVCWHFERTIYNQMAAKFKLFL